FLRDHCVYNGRGRRCAHDLRLLELTRQVEIVCAARADNDAHAVAIDFEVLPDGRPLRHEVRALDHDVWCTVVDVDGARWIDRHESYVPGVLLESLYHFAGRIKEHQFHRN